MYVLINDNAQCLSQDGNWVNPLPGFGVVRFEDEDAARAAIPEGSSARVMKLRKGFYPESSCCVMHNGWYLDTENEFSLLAPRRDKVRVFASMDDVPAVLLDLNVDTDNVVVVAVR